MKNDSSSNTPKPPVNLAGRIWKAFLGLGIAIAGWVFALYLWGSYERAAVMDSWIEVPCLIEATNIDDSQLNQRGVPKYILTVTYRYTFDGKERTSDRYKRLPTEGSDPRKVKAKEKKYPVGEESVCYVNPEDPDFAVLRKDSKAGLYSIWFPCLFIVGGAGMILTAIFRRA
ncbi:MAG: DUF3592 domain-containing protein [Verrucomicrobiales bacterium]